MLFFCYFPLKNNSIKGLFIGFLKKTSKKNSYFIQVFLKKDKSNLISINGRSYLKWQLKKY